MKEKSNLTQNRRETIIVQTSVIGIFANIILAVFKAFVGIITNSIAVTLDAVNNLSDALSSVITILGAKLSGKAPDKKHPFGYGQIELSKSVGNSSNRPICRYYLFDRICEENYSSSNGKLYYSFFCNFSFGNCS